MTRKARHFPILSERKLGFDTRKTLKKLMATAKVVVDSKSAIVSQRANKRAIFRILRNEACRANVGHHRLLPSRGNRPYFYASELRDDSENISPCQMNRPMHSLMLESWPFLVAFYMRFASGEFWFRLTHVLRAPN